MRKMTDEDWVNWVKMQTAGLLDVGQLDVG
jgi:hypothetical protein